MVGIYTDEFINFIKKGLNITYIKITSSNIIIPCPWCEYGVHKNHYHLYISLKSPIFNCFHAGCNHSGFISKFIDKISGTQNVGISKFVDKNKIKKIEFDKKEKIKNKKNIILPKIDINQFPNKIFFLKKRFKFSQNISIENIPGLILDFEDFLRINNIILQPQDPYFKFRDYIQNNFVGFITNDKSYIIFRNIDPTSEFAHSKFYISEYDFLDYYKIEGNKKGKYIILGEGVYDIYSEYLFDFLQKRNDIILYAASGSSNFQNLIKSIVFNENLFKLDILFLADRGIPLEFYKKLKYYNKHFINTVKVYYNKAGKDFNEFPVIVNEFMI